LHGGAGTIERAELTRDLETRYRDALREAAERGGAILTSGGSALDAVTATVTYLEDNELFNAGRGAVFTAEGRNELDASIMDGRTRAAGAVAALTHTRNPVRAARAVMEHSAHVMLVGAGADTFAGSQGLEQVDAAYFFTEGRWQQLEELLRRQNLSLPPRPPGAPTAEQARAAEAPDDHTFGTVGAVAFDRDGNLAAATSTGGTTGKRWGRVGDSPIIGAGTYADNASCAVSATGHGEFFIRAAVAHDICAQVEYLELPLEQAVANVLGKMKDLGGNGGVIAIDARGDVVLDFNSEGMFRGVATSAGRREVAIYR
jgi:beta-aspartyl-peptidase (threonine type)